MKNRLSSRPATRMFLGALGLLAASGLAASPARVHEWSMEHGNLIPNWSFENDLEVWRSLDTLGMHGVARNPGDAYSGRFKSQVWGSYTGSDELSLLQAKRIPVRPGQTYTLSFYFNTVAPAGSPAVRLREGLGSVVRTVNGSSYSSTGGAWALYTMSFTPATTETYADIVLWRTSVSTGGSKGLNFDDVLLEEGEWNSTQVAARRARFGYSVAYSDALGKTYQTQTRMPGAGNPYSVQGVDFDPAGRPLKTPLPVAMAFPSGPDFVAALIDTANTRYNGAPGYPDAGGYAYSEVQYSNDPTSRVIKSSAPGYSWRLASTKTPQSGFYFTATLDIPSDAKNPGNDANERDYRLDWSHNEDSELSLIWTNRRGQVIQTATRASASAWAITKMDYYPSGQVRKLRSPLDTSGANFAEVRNYNAQGLLTSAYSKDRGLEKHWYNKSGMLRFSQNDAQREKSSTLYTYFDYDALGNLISTGEQYAYYGMNASVADGNSYSGGEKIESKGYIYGSISSFQNRTGIALNSLDEDLEVLPPRENTLIVAYHRNPEDKTPGFNAARRLVADFYRHDDQGRVFRLHKYIGAMGDANIRTLQFTYDTLDRVVGRDLYNGMYINPAVAVLREQYTYDALGRVTLIKDGSTSIAGYAYHPTGALNWVGLGQYGDDYGLRVKYNQHVRGWTRDIDARVIPGDVQVYRQALGYEDKAIAQADIPSLAEPRYAGQITQQVYKYASDVPNPVRVVNYTYDPMGRMTAADGWLGTGLAGTKDTLAPSLSLSNGHALDTRVAYDANGRITGKRSGGVSSGDSSLYFYNANSHQLDHVTGKLSPSSGRDASEWGNFSYDAAGRMTEDRSKELSVAYAYDGMPTELASKKPLVNGDTEAALHQLYDASGYRVSQLAVKRLASKTPVYIVGEYAPHEEGTGIRYDAPSIYEAILESWYEMDGSPYDPPDSLILYVVTPDGEEYFTPAESSELTNFMSGSHTVSLVLHGVRKYSEAYFALIAKRQGQPIFAQHAFNMGGQVVAEARETYNAAGSVTSQRRIATIFGLGSPIGRRVITDTGVVDQYYVKNHVGSTMRVVNSDGSYVTTPVFDYQAYGELAQIRDDDLNPVTAKFTGKDFDTTLNLAYFGARWYDSELGIWMSPDPARQFFNPYSYGGNPVRYVDPNGEFLLEAIIISALISGYFSGAAANDSYNPMDWDINQTGDDIMAGMIIGGVSAGLGAGVAAPVAAGGLGLGYVAGGAVSALVNYNMTSGIQAGFSDWSASGALDATLKGAVVGAVSGGVGSYAGNATWNVAGTHGAALLSGAAGGATGAVLNQENILKGAMLGAAAGLAGSVASDVYSRNFGPSPYDSEGINAEGEGGISRAGLPDGTAVVFAGEGGSKWIEYLTGERYSHAGVIEGGNLHQAQILSGKDGANLRTELTKFDSRAYTVVGRGTPNPGAITTGRYNLLWRNCATQAARWSGTISANNPGTYLRVNTGSSYAHPYWNQASWGY